MIYDAIGATRIIRTPPGPSTDNLGTCRLSHRPEDGVCNKWGQTHDIKNLFISDGSQLTTSTAENPTLTIVALAIRQADYIADQIAKSLDTLPPPYCCNPGVGSAKRSLDRCDGIRLQGKMKGSAGVLREQARLSVAAPSDCWV